MKIQFISDTHSIFSDIEIVPCDLLIHAGDITSLGTIEELILYNNWLGSIKHNYKYIISVAGNHDFYAEKNKEEVKKILSNCFYLQEEYLDVEGFKIFGSPYVVKYNDNSFQKYEYELFNLFKDVRADIIISHAPCYDILDFTHEGNNAGSHSLRECIQDIIKPKLFACGHIHEARGILKDGSTIHVNGAMRNKKKTPLIVEI